MYKSAALALLLSAPLAAAEVHTVNAGESGLSFDPKTLTVKTGDTVIFHLFPRHNVITGPFSSPCKADSGDAGFYSGPFSDTDGGKKKFVVNVTSEDPVYFYCGVLNHCQSGMVGGWNLPSSGDTVDVYASGAKSATPETPASLKGGELLDDEAVASLTASAGASPTPSGSDSPSSSGGASTTGSGTPTASGAGGSPSPTSSNAASVMGEIGGAFALVLGAAAYFF